LGRKKIDVEATTSAPPSAVYALLRDGSSWPQWSPIGSFTLEREGTDEREGLGAIRIFKTGRTRSCERIVELVPDRRLSYALESGLPLRGYRADVDLEPRGDGTTIHWRSSFEPKVPGTGWLYRLILQNFIGRTARGLAAYAAAGALAPARSQNQRSDPQAAGLDSA
jgi:uncharacterized protein YndB with AHSA1/START domain